MAGAALKTAHWDRRAGRNNAGPLGASRAGLSLFPTEFPDLLLVVEIAWGADLTANSSGWAWTEITADVRVNPGISCRLGRDDEDGNARPAEVTMLLDNSTAKYSRGGQSPNWPNVRRGTPVRVRLDPDGTGYSTLFYGFADGFTPGWDSLTGLIPQVTLTASGSLRRLQSLGTDRSVYRSVIEGQKGGKVKAYWPMEQGVDSKVITNAFGGWDGTTTAGITWAANDDLVCSDPLPTLGTSTPIVLQPYSYSATTHRVDFLIAVPSGYVESNTDLCYIFFDSGLQIFLKYDSADLYIGATRADHTTGLAYTATGLGNLDADPMQIAIAAVNSGSDVSITVYRTDQDGTATAFSVKTATTTSVGTKVIQVGFSPFLETGTIAFGHVTVQNTDDAFGSVQQYYAIHMWENVEYPIVDNWSGSNSRITRVCNDNGIELVAYSGNGTVDAKYRLGKQEKGTALAVLQGAQDTELGMLWDGRSAGLSYSGRYYREDGVIAASIPATSLTAPFGPTDDDQRTANKVTVSNTNQTSSTYEDSTGVSGSDVIGTYEGSATVNYYSDTLVPHQASWRVNLGTTDGYRYPKVALDLRAHPELATAVLSAIPGQRIKITGIGSALSSAPLDTSVSLVVEGISHDISADSWIVGFNCSLFSPWGVGQCFDTTGDTNELGERLDTSGSTLAAGAVVGDTSISVATTDSTKPLWTTVADNFPMTLLIGGVPVVASACSGVASPQTFTISAMPVVKPGGTPVRIYDPRPLGL